MTANSQYQSLYPHFLESDESISTAATNMFFQEHWKNVDWKFYLLTGLP